MSRSSLYWTGWWAGRGEMGLCAAFIGAASEDFGGGGGVLGHLSDLINQYRTICGDTVSHSFTPRSRDWTLENASSVGANGLPRLFGTTVKKYK